MNEIPNKSNKEFMQIAIKEAKIAEENGDVPIGAVIVYENQVIGKAYNQREQLQDPTAHAEIIALTQAAAFLESWRLNGCTMYVTLEPCCMCAGALVLARIDRLVYGCDDQKTGAVKSLYNIVQDERLNQTIIDLSDILNMDISEIQKKIPKNYKEVFTPIEIQDGVLYNKIIEIAERIDKYPGVSWHQKQIRSYLETGSIAHILGYVGTITREEALPYLKSFLLNIVETRQLEESYRESLKQQAQTQQGQVISNKLLRKLKEISEKISEEDYEAAINSAKKAVNLLPYQNNEYYEQAFFVEALARAHRESGDLDRARREYRKITEMTIGRINYGDIYNDSLIFLKE